MPAHRLIKNCTKSKKINVLTERAEIFFYRLIMEADDYGNYHAHPLLLKSCLFPLKDFSKEDIEERVRLCNEAGLIMLYKSAGEEFLHVINYGQKVRSQPKYPQPDIEVVNEFKKRFDDSLCTEGVQSVVAPGVLTSTITSTLTKTLIKTSTLKKEGDKSPPIPKDSKDEILKKKKEEFTALVKNQCLGYEDIVEEFISVWTEQKLGAGKMRFEKQETFDIPRRLKTFKTNQIKWNKDGKGKTNSTTQVIKNKDFSEKM